MRAGRRCGCAGIRPYHACLPAPCAGASFAARCVRAFERLRAQDFREDCALIVHGGTIMAIMERYALPKGGYFGYQVGNGEGFVLNPDGTYEKLRIRQRCSRHFVGRRPVFFG